MTEERDSGARWFARRLRRHWRWAREQGVGRLVEEDRLNPAERVPTAMRKWWWRRTHDVAPRAVPVFLVGAQRSGTNMLVRGFERSPEFEVRNENDRKAFSRFLLRSDAVVRDLVVRSDHPYILFKPLCDSHRVAELLDGLGTPSPARAVWAYRSVDGRVRSAVAKFGASNSEALREIAAGRGDHLWQAGGLSEDDRALLQSFDLEDLSAISGAALFWYLRNSLYFELGLHEREDVTLACYESLIADPEPAMRALCSFLGFAYRPSLIEHVEPRSGPDREPAALPPEIRRLCDRMQERLDRAYREKVVAWSPRP